MSKERCKSDSESAVSDKVGKPTFFAAKTTKGQELNVSLLIKNRAVSKNLPLYSIIIPSRPKGYIIFEVPKSSIIDLLIRDLRHVKGRVKGTISLQDVERMVKPKATVELLTPGCEVEVIAGPLRGSRGRVVQINKAKNEVVLQIYEATYPLRVTIPGEQIRPIKETGVSK